MADNNKAYSRIYHDKAKELNLKGNEIVVYSIIDSFTNSKIGSYGGGLQYLANCINSRKATVKDVVDGLIKRGLISKIPVKSKVKYNYSSVTDSVSENDSVTDSVSERFSDSCVTVSEPTVTDSDSCVTVSDICVTVSVPNIKDTQDSILKNILNNKKYNICSTSVERLKILFDEIAEYKYNNEILINFIGEMENDKLSRLLDDLKDSTLKERIDEIIKNTTDEDANELMEFCRLSNKCDMCINKDYVCSTGDDSQIPPNSCYESSFNFLLIKYLLEI